MLSKLYWNQFLQNKLLASGKKVVKNNFIIRLDPQIKIKKVNLLSKSQKGKYQNGDYTKWNHRKFSKKKLIFITPWYFHLCILG